MALVVDKFNRWQHLVAFFSQKYEQSDIMCRQKNFLMKEIFFCQEVMRS